MTEQTIIDIGMRAVVTAMEVAAPALLAALFMGLFVSILQAATQIQEQTLSFIPKVVAMAATLVIFGPWILQKMMSFTTNLFRGIPGITE